MKCPVCEVGYELTMRKDGRYECPICEAIVTPEAAIP